MNQPLPIMSDLELDDMPMPELEAVATWSDDDEEDEDDKALPAHSGQADTTTPPEPVTPPQTQRPESDLISRDAQPDSQHDQASASVQQVTYFRSLHNLHIERSWMKQRP